MLYAAVFEFIIEELRGLVVSGFLTVHRLAV